MADFVAPYVPDFSNTITNIRDFQEKRRLEEERKQLLQQEKAARQQSAAEELRTKYLMNQENNKQKKLEEANTLQQNYLKIAGTLQDKNALNSLLKIYNKNPLVQETGLSLDPNDFENFNASKKPAGLEKQIETVLSLEEPNRSNIRELYNTDPAVKTEINAKAAQLSTKPSQPLFESESNKAAVRLQEKNYTKIDELDANKNALNSTIDYIKGLEESSFGLGGEFLGSDTGISLVKSLGFNTEQFQDAAKAKGQLRLIVLSGLKAALGAQFTAKEMEYYNEAIGSLNSQKEVLLFGLNFRNQMNEMEREKKLVENAALSLYPNDLAKAKKVSNKLLNFPKYSVFTRKNVNGNIIGKKNMNFFEFMENIKKTEPNSSYFSVVQKWQKANEENGTSKFTLPSINAEEIKLLDEAL